MEAEIGQPGDRTARVTLKNFVILNTAGDLHPDWSDYIDYWSVDWDSRSDTFGRWLGSRPTRKEKLPLVSAPYAYEEGEGSRPRTRD